MQSSCWRRGTVAIIAYRDSPYRRVLTLLREGVCASILGRHDPGKTSEREAHPWDPPPLPTKDALEVLTLTIAETGEVINSPRTSIPPVTSRC